MQQIEFVECLKSDFIQQEDIKYIVYNQFVALLEDDFDKNYNKLGQIIDNYSEYFFEIPESFDIYINYVINADSLDANTFFKNIKLYFNKNIEFISKIHANNISMKIFETITEHNLMLSIEERIIVLYRQHKLIGFLLFLIFINYINRNRQLSKYFKEFAEHQFLYLYYHQIQENFEIMLSISEIDQRSDDDFDMPQKFKISAEQMVKNYLLTFIKLVIADYNINRKSKDYLLFYQLINKFLKRKEIYDELNDEILNKYFVSYEKRIKQFNIDKSNKYHEDLINLKIDLKSDVFFQKIKTENIDEFIEEVLKYENNGKINVVIILINKFISNYNLQTVFYQKLFWLLKYLEKKNDYKKNILELLHNFSEELEESIDFSNFVLNNYQKNKDEQLIINIISILTKFIFEELPEKIHTDFLLKFFEFIIKTNNKELKYSDDFINKALEYFEEIMILKRNQKIEKAYLKAIDFFDITLKKDINFPKLLTLIKKQDFEKIETLYYKNFIKKNKAEIFQDFIIHNYLTKKISLFDNEMKIIFLFIKTYIDKEPKTPFSTLIEIYQKIINILEGVFTPYSFIKEILRIYPQYKNFYYQVMEFYLNQILEKSKNVKNSYIIMGFLEQLIKWNNKIKYDNDFIEKCLDYVSDYTNKKNLPKKYKNTYKKAKKILLNNTKQLKLL